MTFQKGHTKFGGRQQGVANKRTREIADEAAKEGITPLEVQLRTMRMLWERAHQSSVPDLEMAKQACAVAAQCAPYCHPRLAAIEAKIDAVGRIEVELDLIRQEQRVLDLAFTELHVQHPKVIEVAEAVEHAEPVVGDGAAVDGS